MTAAPLAWTVAPPSSRRATMKRSPSLDCSSIGQSLKRVKISTSPGELRLDRDIEGLVASNRWTSTASRNSPGPNDGGFNNHWGDRRGGRIHGELYCHNARLVRDPVDPLRLRLTCLHQPTSHHNGNAHSSSPVPPERWTYLIQMPRMYPHVPPAITRVTRDLVPNNENVAHLGNMNLDFGASAAIVASSAMQSRVEPPVPEQVLVQTLPPTPNSGAIGGGGGSNDHGSKLLDIDLATACYNQWSPVSSLQDLLDFLMGIPARRREWWSAEANRRHHLEQQRFLRGGGTTPVGQPTMAPASNFVWGHQQHQHQQHQFQPIQQPREEHYISSDMDDDVGYNMMESTMEDAGAIPAERRANPFSENRFDVGYDRGNNMICQR